MMDVIKALLILIAMSPGLAYSQVKAVCTAGQIAAVPGSASGPQAPSCQTTLPITALPAFTGDCTTTAGSAATLCLNTNGVAFGTFATQNYASPPIIGATTPNAIDSTYQVVSGGTGPDNQTMLRVTGTQSATIASAAAVGLKVDPTFTPNGPTSVDGIQVRPTLGASTNTIVNYEGIFIPVFTIGSGYTGTTPYITGIESINVYTDNRTGGTAANPAAVFDQFLGDPITNGTATAGVAVNNNYAAAANTAYATTGGTITNTGFRAALSTGGSTGGTTNNYGFLVTGNGGTNSSGTTTNLAFYANTTADSKFIGGVDQTPIGALTPSTGAFTTLSASSTVSGTGFSNYLASPPAIGGTTAGTGKFSTLTDTALTVAGYVTNTSAGVLGSVSTLPTTSIASGSFGSGVLLASTSIQTVEQLTIATNTTTSNSLILSGSATGTDSNQGAQIEFSNTTAGTQYYVRENAGGGLDFLNSAYANIFSLPASATAVIASNGYSATNATGYTLKNTSGSITTGTTGFGEDFVGTVNDTSAVDGIISFANITCTACAVGTYFADWQVGGSSQFRVDTSGDVYANTVQTVGSVQLGGAYTLFWTGHGNFSSPAANQVQIGAPNGNTIATQTLSTIGALAGTATNTAGANLVVQSGLGTGTGAVSSISMQVPAVTGTGSGQQTAYTEQLITDTALTWGETTNNPSFTFNGTGALTVSKFSTAGVLVNSAAGVITSAATLPVAQGGNGTASPGILAGTNVTVSGAWPTQTVNATGSSTSSTGFSATNTTGYSLTNTSGSITSGTTGFGEDFVGTVNDASAIDGIISFANITCTTCTATSYIADWQIGGVSAFKIATSGNLNISGTFTAGASLNLGATGAVTWNTHGVLSSPAAGNIQLGAANSTTPVAQTLLTQGALSGTASNVGGASLTIQSGLGTGTGTVSNIAFQVPATTGTATAQQTAYTELSLATTGIILGETTNKPKITIAGPLLSGGTTYTIASGTGACATTSTVVGGSQSGHFTCTGTTGASTVTLTLPAATTEYSCWGRDVTTPTTVTQTGAISTTSVTLTMTSVTANNVIQFGCLGD